MNISQHCFMPLTQKNAELGYYNSSAQLVSSELYRSYPIQTYPVTPLISWYQAFSDVVNTKLRTWSSNSTTSQTTNTYEASLGPLTANVVKWTGADGPDQYNVMLFYF